MEENSSRTRYCANCLTTFLGNPKECGNPGCGKERPGSHWGKLLEPGERIDGRFRIDRRLRIAAAGPTYLCQETDETEQAVGSLMVIQVISPEAVADEAYFDRLQEEVAALHELEHPNVVRLQKMVPPSEGPPYLVSQFEAGGTLMDQLREQGSMSLAHVAQLGLQICDGLRAAHRAGMIHGDLNPDRVLLDHIPDPGEPPLIRLTDFGALKTQGSLTKGLSASSISPQYAPPERIDGAMASPESDIYAIGSLLLFAVTLQPLIANAERMEADELVERLLSELPPRWNPPPSLGVDASQIAFFNAALNATMCPDPTHRCNLDEIKQYLEALLEVEDEAVFETPEFSEEESESTESTEASLTADDAIAHFNAFSRDDEMEEEQEEEKEEEEEKEKDKPIAEPKKEKAPTASKEEAPTEEGDTPSEETSESTEKKARDWQKILWRTGWGTSAVVLLLMLGLTWIHAAKPHWLPPSWLEARGVVPLDVMAGDPTNQPDYEALVKSLNTKKGRLLKCGVQQDSLSVYAVIETNGSVRAAGSSYLPRKQKICVRKKLLGMVLSRRSRVRPLRIRTTLVF